MCRKHGRDACSAPSTPPMSLQNKVGSSPVHGHGGCVCVCMGGGGGVCSVALCRCEGCVSLLARRLGKQCARLGSGGRLTSAPPSQSSRPCSPLSLSRLGMFRLVWVFRVCVCVRECVRVLGVSGQREQPSGPAGDELPHPDSCCRLLLLLCCSAHLCVPAVCDLAVFRTLLFFFFFSSSSSSLLPLV